MIYSRKTLKRCLIIIMIASIFTGCSFDGTRIIEDNPIKIEIENSSFEDKVSEEETLSFETSSKEEIEEKSQENRMQELEPEEVREESSNIEKCEIWDGEISVSEEDERVELIEVFNMEEGQCFSVIGPLDFEQCEKFIEMDIDAEEEKYKLKFSGLDLSNMRDGKRKSYSYEYVMEEGNLYLVKENIKMKMVDISTLEKGEGWESEFQSIQGRIFRARFTIINWDEDTLEVLIEKIRGTDIELNGLEPELNHIEKYTFQKGKGLSSISGKCFFKADAMYPFSIRYRKLTEEDKEAEERFSWEEIFK